MLIFKKDFVCMCNHAYCMCNHAYITTLETHMLLIYIYIFIYFIGPLYLSLVNTKRELVDGLLVRTDPISVQEKYLIRFVQVFTLFRLFSN